MCVNTYNVMQLRCRINYEVLWKDITVCDACYVCCAMLATILLAFQRGNIALTVHKTLNVIPSSSLLDHHALECTLQITPHKLRRLVLHTVHCLLP